jgi:hypothetical protein
MNRGIKGHIKAFLGLIGTLTADTLTVAANLADVNSFGWLVQVEAFTFTSVNKVALKLVHSDDNSTFTDCALSDYEGGAIKELTTAADGGKVHAVGYVGQKKFVKLSLDVSGTVSVPVAVTGLSTCPEIMPAI